MFLHESLEMKPKVNFTTWPCVWHNVWHTYIVMKKEILTGSCAMSVTSCATRVQTNQKMSKHINEYNVRHKGRHARVGNFSTYSKFLPEVFWNLEEQRSTERFKRPKMAIFNNWQHEWRLLSSVLNVLLFNPLIISGG